MAQIYAIKQQNDGKVIIGGYINGSYQAVSLSNIARLDSSGSIDTTFQAGAGFNSTVYDLEIQTDDKIVVGGQFTSYSGSSANYIVRINNSGSIDETFNIGEGFNGDVQSLAIQNDGKILAGGQFSSYSGSSVNYIVRINTNGTIDDTFNIGSGFNNAVRSIVIDSNGKIICGGSFTSYNSTSVSRLARINNDGTLDTTLNTDSGFNDTVLSVAVQTDNKIIAGGQFTIFTSASISYNTNRIIRLNQSGSIDKTFQIGTGFNSIVRVVKIQNDEILVGGDFETYNGTSSQQFIKLTDSGSVFEAFANKINTTAIPA